MLFLLVFQNFHAQHKELTLEEIFLNNAFSQERMESFHSMQNGDYYTVLKSNSYGTFVEKYDYRTLEKVETIVHGKDLQPFKYFESYAFDRSETKLIIGVDLQRIYRHSKKGKYYLYDLQSKNLELIADQDIQIPTFSPDGQKIAYVQNNNLFVKFLEDGNTVQITDDGKVNEIINGITDWVYEEEFSFVRAYEWNENSDMISFFRFDEREVPEFSMDIYGESLYPSQHVFKYPKAGEKNSEVSLHIYALNSGASKEIELGDLKQHYLPRMQWTPEAYTLVVTTLNRHQNNLNLVRVEADKGEVGLLLNEKDAAYVEVNDDLTFLDDMSFIWPSEKDGHNHLYHYDKKGELLRQITDGSWEVTKYYGFHPKSKRIFYQSTEEGSINRAVYSIGLNGKKKTKLSKSVGNNAASFSNSLNYFVNTYSSANTPNAYTLVDARTGEELREIQNNHSLSEKLQAYGLSQKEFSTLETPNGAFNMYMVKPNDFDPEKQYPVLMYQYSGPGSQSVSNSWGNTRDYWHQYLAQNGILVVCVDGRGTGYRGRDFKKMTYKELGKYEIEDQIAAAQELGKLPYVDQDRIGIWGWSFGGYMSSLGITKGAEVFKMAIAVAPVTSWRFYDSVYTERYMQTPQENPGGYDDNSPINFANLLQGEYLLIHGTGDDNVHVQNAMRMANALIDAGKDFDYFVYPDRAHGIYKGRQTRLHLYRKMTNFINEHLAQPDMQSALNQDLKH